MNTAFIPIVMYKDSTGLSIAYYLIYYMVCTYTCVCRVERLTFAIYPVTSDKLNKTYQGTLSQGSVDFLP